MSATTSAVATPDGGVTSMLSGGVAAAGGRSGIRVAGGAGYAVDTDELYLRATSLAEGLVALDQVRLALQAMGTGAYFDHVAALVAGGIHDAYDELTDPARAARAAEERERGRNLLARLRDESTELFALTCGLRVEIDENRAALGHAADEYGASDSAAARLFTFSRVAGFGSTVLTGAPLRDYPTFTGNLGSDLLDLGGFGLLVLGDGSIAAGTERAVRLAPGLLVPLLGLVQVGGEGRGRYVRYNGERVDTEAMTPIQRAAMLGGTSVYGRTQGPTDPRTDIVDVWRAGEAPPAGAGVDGDLTLGWLLGSQSWLAVDKITDSFPALGKALGGFLGGAAGASGGAAAGEMVVPVVGAAVGGVIGRAAGRQVGKEIGERAGAWANTATDERLLDLASAEASAADTSWWAREFTAGFADEKVLEGIHTVPTFEPTPTPTSLPEIIENVGDLKPAVGIENAGAVRVTTSTFPDGHRAHVVEMPGITSFGANNGAEGHDMLSALETVAGLPSAMESEAQQAMDMAGVQPGDEVILVGHSGGGALAAKFAADPVFAAKYDITSVVLAGGLNGHVDIPEAIPVVSLQHEQDGVVGLDGRAMTPSANHVTITVDPAQTGEGRTDTHMTPAYADTARMLSEEGVPEWQVFEDGVDRTMGFGREDVTTTSQDFVGMRR